MVVSLDEAVVEKDFLWTGIDEIEKRSALWMGRHPRVSQEDGAVLSYKYTTGGHAAVVLIDTLQVEQPLHAGLQNAFQLILSEPTSLNLARDALLL